MLMLAFNLQKQKEQQHNLLYAVDQEPKRSFDKHANNGGK